MGFQLLAAGKILLDLLPADAPGAVGPDEPDLNSLELPLGAVDGKAVFEILPESE